LHFDKEEWHNNIRDYGSGAGGVGSNCWAVAG